MRSNGTIDQPLERVAHRLVLRLAFGWVLSLLIPAIVGVGAGDVAGAAVGVATTVACAAGIVVVGRRMERRPHAEEIVLGVPTTSSPSVRIDGTGRLALGVTGSAVQAAVGVTRASGGTLPGHVELTVTDGGRVLAADRGRSGALVHAILPDRQGHVVVDTGGTDMAWAVVLRGVVVEKPSKEPPKATGGPMQTSRAVSVTVGNR